MGGGSTGVLAKWSVMEAEDEVIAANRLLWVVRSIFRRRDIEQLRLNPNPSAGILLIITMGAPMAFEVMSYAYSAVMEDCIKDDGGAFQSLPTTNSGSFAMLPIEKGPGAIIS
ncbi:hypothetical protein HOY82DRAFT_542717 [Tuber indicum]|nr:hypothetical protein HOY82DRAFT_542717 [Tuber indicum]